MTDRIFTPRFRALLKKRWSEPFVGIAVAAVCALLVALGWPIARPLLNVVIREVPKEVCDAARWPHRGNLATIIALAALAVLLLRPAWRLASRVLQSWSAGLLSGIGLIWAAATFLILAAPTGQRLSHVFLCVGVALAYSLGALLLWAHKRADIDPTFVMRQLDLPHNQMRHMRSTVVPDDVFASVLENPNPVTKWKDDWIGRAPFVKSVLQRVIIDEDPVVAIIGGFGEGKSSILNLTKEALTPCREVVLVPFSSFLPGDDKTLVASLLGSITAAIKERFIVPGMRKDFARYGRTVAGVIPKVGESLRDFFERPSQAEEVAELKSVLNRLPVRVVVLLDEIDRLQRDELLVLLKLLRGVTDLPRLRFICAFYKETVARAISDGMPGEGYDYLEKFFPVELAIPKIDEEGLRDLFRIRLNSLRQRYSRNAPEDAKSVAEQWEQLWFSAGKRHFTTLRRLSIYFKNLGAVSGVMGKEVNFFDLSVLEAVRQVNPSVFEFIYHHGNLFYFPSWRLSLWPERISIDDKEEQKEINAALDVFFSTIEKTTREIVVQMLSRIFPNVGAYAESGRVILGAPSNDATEADRLKRIYHPDYFHRYFIYQVPASLYGEQELTEFIDRVNDAADKKGVMNLVAEEMATLDKVPIRRADFFDRLPDASQRLKPENAEMLAYCVAEISSLLGADVLGTGEQGRGRAVVFVVANRFVGTSKAHDILEEVIRNATSERFAADMLFFCINRDRNKIILDWKNIDSARLQAAFGERMKAKYSASVDTPIPHDRDTIAAFFTWSKNSESAHRDVAGYIRSRLDKNTAEVAEFIAWMFPGEVAYGSDPSEVVELLFPVKELQARTVKLEQELELTEIQRAALDRFRKLCPPADPPAETIEIRDDGLRQDQAG